MTIFALGDQRVVIDLTDGTSNVSDNRGSGLDRAKAKVEKEEDPDNDPYRLGAHTACAETGKIGPFVLLVFPTRAHIPTCFPGPTERSLRCGSQRERTAFMDPAVVRAAVDELRGLNVAALKTRYLAVFGEESKSSNKQFLFRRIAWRLQANVEGDLTERACRRAAAIASDADLRTRAPKGFLPGNVPSGAPWLTDRSQPQRDWRLPAPGSLLTRRLDDRQIVVKVLEEGFEYESRRYRSLSAIAREVTGTRWNGLLFFGLAERPDA